MIERVLFQIAADDAEPARDHGQPCTDIRLAGNIVEVDPLLDTVYNALGTQNLPVFTRVKRGKRSLKLLFGKFPARLHAPACEYFVSMVMVLMTVAAMPVLMVAMRVIESVIFVMMPVMAMLVMVMLVFVAMVVMTMIVLIFIGMTAMPVLMIVVLVSVVMVMIMVAVFVLVIMHHLGGKLFKLLFQGIFLLHGSKNLLAVDRVPVGRHNGNVGVLAQKSDRLFHLRFIECVREHDTTCMLDLIEEKFPEVLEVHLAFLRVHDGAEGIELRAYDARLLNGTDDIRELADTRRLNDNAIG